MPTQQEFEQEIPGLVSALRTFTSRPEIFWLRQSRADALRYFGDEEKLERSRRYVIRHCLRNITALSLLDALANQCRGVTLPPELAQVVAVLSDIVNDCRRLKSEASA